ncbi:DNA modification methylase [Candidatus Sulfotelmatobacter sp. SbA7]|jgi:site-specific DNA-methyltransferase (adenine-specific)|nr:DNA modification methylase [Candidatus Sulfotelmatobacter sp. SbA7]
MRNNPLPRLDERPDIRELLQPYCRLRRGEVWADPVSGHRVGCLDAANDQDVAKLMDGNKAIAAIHDPPYNLVAFEEQSNDGFIQWCQQWVKNGLDWMERDASLYVWLGADQRNGFQPLPDFMIMMRALPVVSRSFITMRNQRGYGTQRNWMAVRQELLYYTKGDPIFNVDAEYTDIPKILRGYYKKVNGRLTENAERSNSENIRAGNVWVDIQQVFYRVEENVSGCYAQKPLKCIDRIVRASSNVGHLIVDFFAHSGTTLLACEVSKRRCFTLDVDPIFCEIAIRRLENYRQTGRLGWQNSHPFEGDLSTQFAPPPETVEDGDDDSSTQRSVVPQSSLF